MTARARLLIADDSAFVRKTLIRVFAETPDVVVVGEAVDAVEALAKIAALAPDVVTLDLEMPGMESFGLLRRIRRSWPKLPTLVLASAREGHGGAAVFDALSLGAFDFVDTSRCTPMELHLLGPEILAKVRTAVGHRFERTPSGRAIRESNDLPRDAVVVCIGASTGGPPAIQTILERLDGSFPIPVAIVQHMPPSFLPAFAHRLSQASALEVGIAQEGERVRTGRVLIAPPGRHLIFSKGESGPVIHIAADLGGSAHVPSVDALFSSAAECFGKDVIAVVLTGMGVDGRSGARALAEKGAFIVAEAAESCAVYGMPRAVEEAGLASALWPLDRIVSKLARLAEGRELDRIID